MGLTKQQLEALNDFSFPNNTAGLITPETLRFYNDSVIVNTVNQDVYSTESSSFNSRINSITSSVTINTGSLVTTASFNAYTASQDFKNNTFATTGSNTFTGNQTMNNVIITSTNNGAINFSSGSPLIISNTSGYGIQINLSSSLNRVMQLQNEGGIITVSGSSTQIQNVNFIPFSSSLDSRLDSLETAGYVTSAITASSLVTASVSQSTITFTKGDGSQFNIVVADVSGSAGDFVTTASFNTYTASQDFKNTTFATTSSNVFTGVQTLSDVDRLNQIGLDDYSGSLVLFGKGFTSSSMTHITASTSAVDSIIFKTNNNTAATLLSGSANLFVNPAAPTTGFTRLVGTAGNIELNASNVPQISSSMVFPITMNNNYFGGNGTTLTARGPVSSSAYTISGNSILGTVNIGQSATLHADKLTSGLTMTANNIAGTLNIIATQSPLTSSATNFNTNFLAGIATLNLSSSAVAMANNIINDSAFTFTNQFYSSSLGLGTVSVNRNNIAGQGQTFIVSGSQPAGTTTGASVSDNIIGGGSNTIYVDIANAAVSGANAYHNAIRNIVFGNQLIITGSSVLADTTSFGSAFFGRWNDLSSNKAKTAQTIFAVGTGTSTSNRKTGFLIDSGSNTFIEGTLNVSGSLTIQSGSNFFAYGNKQGNVGSFYSTVTQSGSANVSQSMTFNTTDISNGITMVSGSQFTFENAGVYNIQFSAQVLTDTGADDVWIWLKKNGTNIADTAGRVTLNNNDELMAAWNYVVSLNTNDYIEIAWQSTNGDAVLLYNAPTGNIPAVTSVIATVTQVK